MVLLLPTYPSDEVVDVTSICTKNRVMCKKYSVCGNTVNVGGLLFQKSHTVEGRERVMITCVGFPVISINVAYSFSHDTCLALDQILCNFKSDHGGENIVTLNT